MLKNNTELKSKCWIKQSFLSGIKGTNKQRKIRQSAVFRGGNCSSDLDDFAMGVIYFPLTTTKL